MLSLSCFIGINPINRGVPESGVQAIVGLEKEKEEERMITIYPHLAELLDRPPISFSQYVSNITSSLSFHLFR